MLKDKTSLFLVSLTGLTAALITGCSFALDSLHPTNSSNGSGNSQQSTPVTATQIDYATINTQVISNNCLECHSAAAGNKGGINLETYQNLKANLIDVQADLADDSMPKDRNPLSAAEKDLVNTWIKNGAPETVSNNNPTGPSVSPSPTPPAVVNPPPQPSGTNYQTVNSQVLQPYCLSCHSAAGGNRAGINLESYSNVLKNITAVKSTINSGSMPRGTTLSASQKKLILDWIAAGAPQTAAKTASTSSVQVMTKAYVDFMLQQSGAQ